MPLCARAGSRLRKTRPEANFSVSSMPASAATARRNAFGFLQQQPAAVAGFPVAGDRPTMGQTVERSNSRPDQPMAGLVVEVGYQAKPAAIAFVGVFIESLCRQRSSSWPQSSSMAETSLRGAQPASAFCGVLCAEGECCPPRQAISCDGSVGKSCGQDARAGCEPRGWQSKSLGSEAGPPPEVTRAAVACLHLHYVPDNTGPQTLSIAP